MRCMYPILAVALALAIAPVSAAEPPAQASNPLQLRPKSGIATLTPTHRFAPFVDNRDTLFRSRLLHHCLVAIGGTAASHETDDVIELVIAVKRTEDLAEILCFCGGD